MTTTDTEVVELKPCPFCQQPLSVTTRINPTARCDTEGCWVHESKFAIPVDSPLMVARWNTRALTPAQAAGPVLLEAAKALIKRVENYKSGVIRVSGTHECRALHHAITQAEGPQA